MPTEYYEWLDLQAVQNVLLLQYAKYKICS